MAISIPIPSGLALSQVLDDVEALANAPLDAFLPADVMRLIIAAEKIVGAAVILGLSPSAATVLQTEVTAEQVAGDQIEDAKFPPGT